MGYATGGSVESISIAGREFSVSADADTQRKLGGFMNEMIANGDGTARVSKTRIPWAITGLEIEIDDNKGDHEFIQDLIDAKSYKNITVTYASGAVYQGKGTVTGENQTSSKNASMSLELSGPQKLTKQ